MIIRSLRYLFCEVKFDGNPEDILTTFNPGYYKDGVPVYGLCKDSSGMVSDKLFNQKWYKLQKSTLQCLFRPSKLKGGVGVRRLMANAIKDFLFLSLPLLPGDDIMLWMHRNLHLVGKNLSVATFW